MYRTLQSLAILLGLISISPVAVSETGRPMVFDSLTVHDGLSQNTVLDIHQDSQGFIWIATESGLNRYDGFNVLTYSQDRSDPDALQSSFIWDIEEDANGDLWLATKGGGLARWLRREDRFVSYTNDPANPRSLSSNNVRSVLVDSSGMVWAGTRGGGLNRLDPTTGQFERFLQDANRDGAVYDILQARDGTLWIGTDDGLHTLRPEDGATAVYRHNPDNEHSLSDNVIMTVFQDRLGAIWVGTFNGGLNRFDSITRQIARFVHDPADPNSLSHNYVWAIEQDDSGRLWIGTQDGLNLFHRRSQSFSRYDEVNYESNGIGSSYIMSLYQDSSGLLWIGTRGAGARTWNPRSWAFGHVLNKDLEGSMAVSFAANDNDKVWVAALGAELALYDLATGTYETLQSMLPEGVALSDSRAMSLLAEESDVLWVGTMTGGLNRVDLAAGRIDVFRHDPADATSISANGVMALARDGFGELWVGTFGGGLNRFDAATQSFERFEHDPADPHSFSGPRATAIAIDQNGNVWAGTDDAGLNLLLRQSRQIIRFNHNPDNADSLSSNGVYALHVDDSGNVWVGTTDSGLDRVVGGSTNPSDIRFRNYSNRDGLQDNAVYGVQSDLAGRIWISGNAGLAVLDSESGAVQKYHRRHGLQDEEFNFGAHHRDAKGRLYFGGANGFNVFQPAEINQTKRAPRVALTAFRKFNVEADVGVPHSMIESVNLGFDDDVVSFEFAALDFIAPDRNRYMYQLQGFDRDWVDAGNRNRVTYTNLGAGDYVFRVRAANSDGVWNDNGLSIPVTVAPSPWQSPAAYGSYVALAALLVAMTIHWHRRRLKFAAQLQELAYYDSLTGLPNAKLLRKRIDESLAVAKANNEEVALLYLDLDRFQRINDTLGHDAGDRVLQHVAGLLSQCRHQSADSIQHFELARLSGDEFIIFIRHHQADANAVELADRIQQALKTPLLHEDQKLVVTASIGGALFPGHGEDSEALLKAANIAEVRAKRNGRNQYQRFSDGMSARAVLKLTVENEIRQALQEDQFQLYFQPKYDAETLEIVGAEALVRWFHPTRGEISPADFIPVAEESGQISDLTHWVVNNAFKQLRAWKLTERKVMPIAVNMSARDFRSSDPVSMVAAAAAANGMSPSLLEIEITESALMRNEDQVCAALHELRKLGCSVAIDDFGTGYSSLSYLRRFPIDALKVDRSFVSDITSDHEARSICSAIVAMARVLGLKVVAEGVENEGQLRQLRNDGCDVLQGFLLSRAQPADVFMDLFLKRRAGTGSEDADRRRDAIRAV